MSHKYLKLILIAGVVVILDQITKLLIVKTLPLHTVRPVIEGFFNLVHVHNPGGAFGLMAGMSPAIRTALFLFVSAMAVGLILYFYHTTPANLPWLAAGAMPAETVARKTVKAIRRGKHEIILTPGGKALVWFDRLCPPLVNWLLAKFS